MKIKLLILITMALILSACHPVVVTLTLPPPSQTQPMPKLSETSKSTLTTSTSQAKTTQTAAVYNNQTQAANDLFTSTAIVYNLQQTVIPHEYQQFISPNGDYRANFIVFDCTNIVKDINPFSLETLKINEISQQTEWIVKNRLIYCGGEGSGGRLGGLFWSNNSRYFYYTDNWYDQTNTIPMGWINLAYRYDTTTKEILSLSGIALSSDKLKIAAGDGRDLVIWDLNGNEIARFPGRNIVPDETSIVWLHYLAWSPDGDSIAYILTKQSTNGAPNTSFVLIANMDMKLSSLLFDSDNPEFIEIHWKDQNHLSLLGDGYQNFSNWEYSIADKLLTPEIKNTSIP